MVNIDSDVMPNTFGVGVGIAFAIVGTFSTEEWRRWTDNMAI